MRDKSHNITVLIRRLIGRTILRTKAVRLGVRGYLNVAWRYMARLLFGRLPIQRKRQIRQINAVVIKVAKRVKHKVMRASIVCLHRIGRVSHRTWRAVVRSAKQLHRYIARKPHEFLQSNVRWYNRWHSWRFHAHVHYGIAGTFTTIMLVMIAASYRHVQALPDLYDNWDFSSPSNYVLDDGVEIVGSTVTMKALNYISDTDTAGLYHFDAVSGATAVDSSASANDGLIIGSPTWVAGSLNNAHSFSGGKYATLPDSAPLSLAQTNSLEAWTKFDTAFGVGTHDRKQGVLDKGAYRLYYDQETAKVTYELENASATTWTQQAGNDIKGSWDLNGKFSVNAQVNVGADVYVGLGNAVGDAEVWKWNGTTWTQIGGDGKNSSWADQTFEAVWSLAVNGTTIYAGLGSNAGDGEVWSCDTASGCTTWNKIGGDGLNGAWAVNTMETVESMTVMGGNLYVGTGNSANDARVYRWNGSTWAWVGGFGIGGPYNAFTTGYEDVYSMTNDGTNVYVGFGATAGDADVWRLTGTTWTQIGGDTLNTSWAAATNEYVTSLRYYGGNLYAGLGTTAGDAEVWSYNGTTWAKIGGDSLNSGWDATFEAVYALADDGANLYAGLGNTASDNEVWRYNGTTWTKIGGDGLNGGFTNTHTIVQSLLYANSTLYAGLTAAGANAEEWAWNGTTWTRIGGGYINKSWGHYNLQDIESMTVYGDGLYAGTGNTVAGNAMVFRFDGTTWQVVGGQGNNGSWAAATYENVLSMISFGGNLYAGLGTTAGDAEVWRYNGTTWTQIGGDTLNSSWAAGFEEVYAMATVGGNLYAGLGNSANDAEVWRYNGSSWTKIGGDSLNSGWTTNFERVSSLTVFSGSLYAGLGASTTDAEVWRWSGSAWAKVGGDGLAGSWNTSYEQVESMTVYDGKLYAGLGNTTTDAELWEYNGTTWAKIGGDGVNASWIDGQYEQVKSLVVYNAKLYAGLANSAGDGEVWEYDNGSWARVGGSAVNSSWPVNATESVRSFSVYQGKLYAGLGDSANVDAAIWSYGSNGFLQSTTAGQDTAWHHVAATYDGSSMKLYVDGTLDASTSTTLSIPDTAQALLIGSTYGPSESGWSQGYFEGSLDEVRISRVARSSFNTKPYATSGQRVTLATAVRKSGVWHWDDFVTTESPAGGYVTYRLSADEGTTWYYWDGSAWAVSTTNVQSNDAATIDAHIQSFPSSLDGLLWQAVLTGDGTQRVALNQVQLASTSDLAEPTPNAADIVGYTANGGSSLAVNGWTNGASPKFTWTPAADSGSGIRGYCVYVGTDNTADPISTKGMLGVSPTATGGHCQFVVSGPEIDLGTPGYLATPLTTSSAPYYVTVKAIDNAANVTTGSGQFYFRFDNTPPANPGFITAPSGFVNTKDVTLTWPTTGPNAPDDVHSGLVGLQYRIGPGGTWYGDGHTGTGDGSDLLTNDGSYSTIPTPDHTDLVEGVNTVYFRAWDSAGNVSSSYVTAALKINTTGAPSEPQNLQVTPATNTVNAFSFTWAPPATFVGAQGNLTYCYTVNSLPTSTNCTFTGAGSTSLGSAAYATQPGANTLYVVAKDESNNVNYANYASVVFTANTPSPGIPLNVDLVDVSIKSTSNWRLALTWDLPAYSGAGISNYTVYRSTDNVTFVFVGSSSSTTYIDAGLSQQRYYYHVKACDSTNNCGAQSTVVNGLPTGKYTSPALLVTAPRASDITTKRASIAWSTDRSSDSKIAIGTQSGKYSSSEIGNSDQVSAHEIKLDNLSAGTTYYYVAKWTDEDGNSGTSQEFTFRTAPAPQLKEIVAVKVGLSAATIEFTSRDATKVVVMYGQSDSFGGVKTVNTSAAESTYRVELNDLADGAKYLYKLVAYDSEGNSYDGSVASFTTPPRPRITDLRFQPVEGEPTSTQLVSWQTNVPSTSELAYSKIGSRTVEYQSSELVTTHEVLIHELVDDSEYSLVAQSRDKDGNLAVSDAQAFHTALDTRPPKVTDVIVEASIRGTGAEARGQLVVSWKTDEPATSQVAYTEGSNPSSYNSRTSEDTALTTEHIVIVSDLPTSKVFSVQPVSRDRANNAGQGQSESAIIGRASDSVLTVILNTLQKVFGL